MAQTEPRKEDAAVFTCEILVNGVESRAVVTEPEKGLYRATLADNPGVQAHGTSIDEALRKVALKGQSAAEAA